VQISIARLGKDHKRSRFESGDADLDTYLRFYALQNQSKHQVGTTYVATEESQPDSVIGYYTLAATGIPFYSVAEVSGLRRLPYKEVPAVLLGRLAVTKTFQNRGLGSQLLGDAVRRSLGLTQVIGCRCLFVDAYPSAIRWYAKFGLIELGSDPPKSKTRRMVLDLRTAAIAAQSAASALHRKKSSK
jgi:GNAT superfamily N-acetyltransferase